MKINILIQLLYVFYGWDSGEFGSSGHKYCNISIKCELYILKTFFFSYLLCIRHMFCVSASALGKWLGMSSVIMGLTFSAIGTSFQTFGPL